MHKKIRKCRLCGNTDLTLILDLGNQTLTGIFPKSKTEQISTGPLELVKCNDADNCDCCGLVQLNHSYDNSEMYGDNYGYRSGLNKAMVKHLNGKIAKIQSFVGLKPGDLVLDIGSNDSTLLQAYSKSGLDLVGIDPTGNKFKKYYPDNIRLIPDFFSSKLVKEHVGEKKAKVVTSIAMFYDLESPMDFAKEVSAILDDNGVWVLEQSYLPTMLEMNAYDTVCHEHLEYYSLKQIKWIADKLNMKILDVEFNDINGGSFSVMLAKASSSYEGNGKLVEKILLNEKALGLHTLKPYEEFKQRVLGRRKELIDFIQKAKKEGKCILGYAASTKGNVILQFCGITDKDVSFIAEVNTDKFGCYTPGTNIPIISEEEAKNMNPDYFLVLAWHFRKNIIEREKRYLESGGKFIFPLPYLEVV